VRNLAEWKTVRIHRMSPLRSWFRHFMRLPTSFILRILLMR
jgi:hypothetical protein